MELHRRFPLPDTGPFKISNVASSHFGVRCMGSNASRNISIIQYSNRTKFLCLNRMALQMLLQMSWFAKTCTTLLASISLHSVHFVYAFNFIRLCIFQFKLMVGKHVRPYKILLRPTNSTILTIVAPDVPFRGLFHRICSFVIIRHLITRRTRSSRDHLPREG